MKKVRFSELFDFQSKSKIPANKGKDNGKFPFYTSSSVLSKYLDEFQHHGEFLIFGTGGTASIHYASGAFSTSSHCSVAKPSENHLFNPKFVYYYLNNNIQILEGGFKGAGLKNISESFIENIIIPFPSISIQNQIVFILDKATNILNHCDRLVNKLDEFIESLYLSSFGLKAYDHRTWSTVSLEKLASENKGSMRTGPFGSNLLHHEFMPTGDVLVLGLENVASNYYKESAKYITEAKYESLKSYRVFPRDLLIALMGTGTTGKSAVAPDTMPLAINTKHLAAITLNNTVANPYYISSAIRFDQSIINQIEAKNKGAVIPGINLSVVKNIKLKLPPINKQNEFEKIIRKVEDSLKTKIVFCKKNAKALVDSISHQAFFGDLKTNIEAFTFDENLVNVIEKESAREIDPSRNIFKEIKLLIQNIFGSNVFTYDALKSAVHAASIEIEYEYPPNSEMIGLKDTVFKLLQPGKSEEPFLKQLFALDEHRDAEKGADNSQVVLVIND